MTIQGWVAAHREPMLDGLNRFLRLPSVSTGFKMHALGGFPFAGVGLAQ